MKKIVVVFFIVLFSSAFSSAQDVIDTLKTGNGTMLIYKNRTWEYLEDRTFSGIMNPHLHNVIASDSAFNFIQSWNTDVCYTSNRQNNLTALKDTIWLCLVDSLHEKFKMPFQGIVTSRYGYRHGRYHNGIDLDLESGDTVRATFSGKIRYSKYNGGGFGNLVIIRHYNGLETFYAHLEKCLVVPNEVVKAGDPIGIGGSTGHSSGSHLHFEVRFYDAPMNPEEIIDFKKLELRNDNLLVHSGLFNPGAASSYNSSGDAVATTASSSSAYHKVRSGETLSYIAQKYHTSVSRICSLNRIRETTLLQIGRSLRVR